MWNARQHAASAAGCNNCRRFGCTAISHQGTSHCGTAFRMWTGRVHRGSLRAILPLHSTSAQGQWTQHRCSRSEAFTHRNVDQTEASPLPANKLSAACGMSSCVAHHRLSRWARSVISPAPAGPPARSSPSDLLDLPSHPFSHLPLRLLRVRATRISPVGGSRGTL
jgi:hypothetical protein